MTSVWVLGQGGLLGSHAMRALERAGPILDSWSDPIRSYSWTDPPELERELTRSASTFARARGEAPWAVIWAAGAGVIGSPPDQLAQDLSSFESLLAALGGPLGPARSGSPGLVVLVSSAGAVYASGSDLLVTESSGCRSVSGYGTSRLQMEAALQAWIHDHPRVSSLTARVTNLYGPGQNLTKRQGLVSHLLRAVILRRPAHVYVPRDTLLDLLYAPDCARRLIACMQRLASRESSAPSISITKIFAAERSTPMSMILQQVGHLARRPLRVLTAPSESAVQHTLRMRFRSAVWRDLDAGRFTDFKVGLHRTYTDLYARYRDGNLALPARQEERP